MYVSESADSSQRAVRVREALSLALMCVPLVAVLSFLVMNPGALTTDFAVFFSQDRTPLRSDSGWLLSGIALLAATLCAVVGVVGTQQKWQYNRRWQRGILGSLAATTVSVLLNAWSMTQEIELGATPSVGLAMFLTMCAMLYGVLCAAISPSDLIDTWYPDQDAHEESETL
ncbi:hypothetical protein [Leucobacter sp. 1207-22]|uniref:hypothetical protein n=1 Tax=Leucobacter sp. 1207-22 TaxID=2604456 RepID=UPI004064BE86